MAVAFVGATNSPMTASTTVDVTQAVTNGNLIVIVQRQQTGNNRTWSISQTAGTAITFTKQLDTDTTINGGDTVIWTGTAQATETITIRVTANSSDTGNCTLFELSGADTTTPNRGTGSQYNTSSVTDHDMLGTGVDVTADDMVIGSFRLQNGASATITPPSDSTAQYTESQRGGIYYKAFGSASVGEIFRATSGTARTSECGGIVIAVAAGGATQPPRSMHQFRQRV